MGYRAIAPRRARPRRVSRRQHQARSARATTRPPPPRRSLVRSDNRARVRALNGSGFMSRWILAITATTAALIPLTASSLAQDWPNRTVRIVSPYAAGGASDVVGNIIAEKLGQHFNQRFVVDNQPGRGGQIGSMAVARAAP